MLQVYMNLKERPILVYKCILIPNNLGLHLILYKYTIQTFTDPISRVILDQMHSD